ncbi:MAG: DUF92 domain-containing protein [Anaerolineales bacterium]|nr:DUF92 domain-containing protein [Anaerolineales bacterium]MCB9127863.1 DUF92 domain-containing protein [Ardenticatenales bacterium]
MWQSVVMGLVLGVAMAVGGYWKQALDRSGAIAAAIVGSLIFVFGGWRWGLLLVAFFVASSALSFVNPERKQQVAAEKFDKGSRRDAGQVLANGGWVALLALLSLTIQDDWLFPAVVGALATVTADTWATELGTLSTARPRLITSGQPVPAGTSGGISALGSAAALAGAWFIGAVALLLTWVPQSDVLSFSPAWLLALAAISGVAGAMFDSLLGATVQAIHWCPRCQSETERAVHRCGTATHPLRGLAWLDNDMVNFLASVVGSLVAVALALQL